jgi:hypothetical protein
MLCIAKDNKITGTLINGTAFGCTEATSGIEKALGNVENQELLLEYYEDEENETGTENQSLKQK